MTRPKSTKKKSSSNVPQSRRGLPGRVPPFDKRLVIILGICLVAIVGVILISLSHAGTALIIPGNYDAVAGAIYVDPKGNDANAGTMTAPLASVAKGITKTPTGGTLILRGGTYNEGSLSIYKAMTVQSYKGEQVWLDGTITQSTGWTADANRWRLDNSPSSVLCKHFETIAPTTAVPTPPTSPCIENSAQMDAAYPMAGSPQMVFRNNVALKDVSTLAKLTPGSFFYNISTNQLYLGDNPTGQKIEIAVQRKALDISASNVNIKGIGFRRYGTIEQPGKVDGAYSFGMVQISGVTGGLVENSVFTESASRGMFVGSSSGVTMRGNIFTQNGMNGADIAKVTGLIFEQNTVTLNNTEKFSTAAGTYAVVAGSKFTGTTGAVRDNVFDNNGGTGWWCDLYCTDMTVVRNIASNNLGHGIYYEVSSNAIIASNLIYNNDRNGIQVKGTNVKIWNNTLSKNRQNIAIYEDDRNKVASENTRSVVIKNNILSGTNGKEPNEVGQSPRILEVNGINYPESVDPGQMVTELDYNTYYRPPTTTPTKPYFLGWGSRGTTATATTFAELRTISGREAHGLSVESSTQPFFVNEAANNFTLKAGSAVINTGDTLPADIAAAIGVSVSKVNMGILRWPSISATPTPTAAPTSTPTATPTTPSPTAAPTIKPTSAPTLAPTATPTLTPIVTVSPTVTETPVPVPSFKKQ